MPRLPKTLTLKKTITVALQWTTCLLLLLAFFCPLRVSAIPLAVQDDEYDVLEDSDDSENHLYVLENDNPSPSTRIVGVTQGLHGSVEIGPGNLFVTYQPYPDFYGTDEFTYRVDDGSGGTPSATVRITVTGINDRPTANDDTATTNEDTPVIVNVLSNDSDIEGELDPTSVKRISGPSHGQATVDPTSGLITYTPDRDWHGQDTFTYRVWDLGDPLPVMYDQANVYVTVRPVSDKPVADAGPDQSAPTLSTVTLDGSGSYDPDGDIELTYLWQQTGGSQQVTLSSPTAQSPTFVGPDDPEVLEFSLRVFDDQGDPSANTDYVQVTITNQTPVADAGEDKDAYTDTLVTLDGSGSYDPDHDALTFEWTQTGGPTVSLDRTIPEKPTFTAPATEANLTFTLRVRDAYGARSFPSQTQVEVRIPPTFSIYLPATLNNYVSLPDLVVKTIAATKNNIRIVLENQGSAAVTHGFYVDAYINPKRAPASANETWDTDGISNGSGLVWAIEVAQNANPPQGVIAPLAPGATLTLNVGDAFYQPGYSSVSWPLAVNTRIYAQVDSYPAPSPHNGLVLETHEYYDQAYNNITGPVYSTNAVSGALAPSWHAPASVPLKGLPPRP